MGGELGQYDTLYRFDGDNVPTLDTAPRVELVSQPNISFTDTISAGSTHIPSSEKPPRDTLQWSGSLIHHEAVAVRK